MPPNTFFRLTTNGTSWTLRGDILIHSIVLRPTLAELYGNNGTKPVLAPIRRHNADFREQRAP